MFWHRTQSQVLFLHWFVVGRKLGKNTLNTLVWNRDKIHGATLKTHFRKTVTVDE